MTTATATPIPVRPSKPETDNNNNKNSSSNSPAVPSPTLRLHIQDLHHPAAIAFLRLIPDLAAVLDTALAQIIKHLYTSPSRSSSNSFTPSIPPTRSVTIILRDFSGVAYTTGTDLDNDHKEIHFSLSYIRTATTTNPDPHKELIGVLTHELVHCYQHTTPPAPPPSPSSSSNDPSPTKNNNNPPHPPSGLIEGIADFVRLKANLDPPHWKRPSNATDRPDRWDAGYQHTAFFLAWLEDVRVGQAAIGRLNDRLFRVGYVGDGNEDDNDDENQRNNNNGFWKALFGVDIVDLWDEYGRYLDGGKGGGTTGENWEEEIVNPE
ncbi:hypothetical protein DTO271G3_3857 [Paecilomyces variotii]|nr:hypothetical protein DTO271G3_3857 [Paecilomyces variotii]